MTEKGSLQKAFEDYMVKFMARSLEEVAKLAPDFVKAVDEEAKMQIQQALEEQAKKLYMQMAEEKERRLQAEYARKYVTIHDCVRVLEVLYPEAVRSTPFLSLLAKALQAERELKMLKARVDRMDPDDPNVEVMRAQLSRWTTDAWMEGDK